ncbi:MAG: tetratricopeptide repeat protein [Campylobacterota bacterium]|nr:tetratricopeptide repeat protein [Campylobacterota bacterium]
MAELEEDIIIIEDSDAATLDEDISDNGRSDENEESKKKKLIIFGGLGVVLALIILIVTLLALKSSNNVTKLDMEFIEEKLQEKPTKIIEQSKLENMIAKANYLYSSGSKQEALFLYEKIALYSEAISQYNLGVAQLKDREYETALKTFQKAILNDEKRCVSAINAAVCSLHLEDKESFRYYIDLAHAYLANEIDSPLYSYYYALINYYNKNYYEALSALKNPTSDEYPNTQKHLSTKIDALFGNDYSAIEAMEKNFTPQDSFSIGLLYARVGDLTLATKHLEEAILKNIEPIKAKLALGFVNLKAGRVSEGSKNIKDITDSFGEEVYKPYPIKVTLKESLFEPFQAQNHYRNIIENDRNLNYQKIFYYSPYKIFNADQTISYIRKGNANIYIDDINSAKKYLKKSASSSSVNIGITKAIKKALKFKIREANLELQELVKLQPKHSIMHYNLALTYAQLGNMTKAHKHFLRSYHLDAKNYLSGVYTIMASQLINRENSKLLSILKDSLLEEDHNEKTDLYKTLLYYSQNNIVATADWLNNDYKQRPLYLALDILIALKLNRLQSAEKSSQKLTILLPKEILPHLMYIDANFYDLKPQNYAKEVIKYLNAQNFHFNDLYFGAFVTRYLYIQQNLITGKLFYLREQLRSKLETTNESTSELISSLALASLYDGAFEKAYTLFNQLIDDNKIRDAYTLFLGAVASTASGHHENAIALLELSKMKDSNFLEARYALGLLYLQVKNNQGAAIQLNRVGDSGFTSEYFNFKIDLDKLLFEKQHPTS